MEENTDRLALQIMFLVIVILLLTAKWFLIPKIHHFMGSEPAKPEIVFFESEEDH